jgi:hypothetical protein
MIAERKACSGIGPGAVVVPGLEALRSVFAGLARLMPNEAQKAIVNTTMEDTSAYLSNRHIQCYVEDSLEDLLDAPPKKQGPIIAIAHSMGSLLLYKTLFTGLRRLKRPVYLITIGSMLAEPSVQQAMLGSLTEFPAPIPPAVVWWRNVMNDGDVLAFKASEAFESDVPGKRPLDVTIRVGNGINRHSAGLYLSSPEFGRLVHQAWCSSSLGEQGCSAPIIPDEGRSNRAR